jgi:hypothetical protein
VVSIRSCPQWSGVCFHRPEPLRAAELACLGRPAVLLPARLRRACETAIIIALAGRIGEELAGPWRSGYRSESADERHAEQVALMLTQRERALLSQGEGGEESFEPDEERATEMSRLLVGQEAAAHVLYLRAVTRSLVYSERFKCLVEALAPELLAYGTLSGRRVSAIFKQAEAIPRVQPTATGSNRKEESNGQRQCYVGT